MNRLLALIIALGVLIVLAFSCLFVVDQRQSAVVFAFGEIRRVITEPGLYAKLPSPLQDVRYFDRRTLTYDSDEIDRFITAEKINIQVDSFVKWRIADPRQFYVSVGYSPQAADDRIGRQLRSALNNEIARLSVADVISSARETLVSQVMRVMSVELEKIGVSVVDVRLKRVDFAPEVAERVYERMRSERTRVANARRAKGAAEGERIRADADRQREIAIAGAYRDAQKERGAGDAEASRLYAQAFGKNPEFASFYRSLEAYRASFADRADLLVLNPQSEFFRYFQSATPAAANDSHSPAPPFRGAPAGP
ncbi:MAG: protease modulator HflC [Lautropia sp.]|nr:protease modulator HflC [Lautropia sp.]